MPSNYWTVAFQTIVYLINRMPTLVLQYQSPFVTLFHKPSNLRKLRVFGCLCYPWLHPYAFHKLTSQSNTCVFIDNSFEHNAFHCYNLHTHKIFKSRHVIFVEFIFSFHNHTSPTIQTTSLTISHWGIPPIQPDEPPMTSSSPSSYDLHYSTPSVQQLLIPTALLSSPTIEVLSSGSQSLSVPSSRPSDPDVPPPYPACVNDSQPLLPTT